MRRAKLSAGEGWHVRCLIALAFAAVAATGALAEPIPTLTLTDSAIESLGGDIVRNCPSGADADTNAARDACATALGSLATLDEATIRGTLRWGGVSHEDFDPAHNSLTVLNALVWRKVYLSLFAFTGASTVEVLPDESRLLRLAVHLRRLPNSEFPYPFWHSQAKWRSYQQATQVALLFKGGKLIAGYRNARVDAGVAARDETWNGVWTTDPGHTLPRTALFDYLLSADNPYVRKLDAAYKSMALEARQFQCDACHNPANPASMNPLIIFNLPSQALSGRHQIVYEIDHNEMPPKQGISDASQRQKLLRTALDFERIGDQALDFETRRAARNRD